MKGRKTSQAYRPLDDRFVERLTDVVLACCLREVHRQFHQREAAAATAGIAASPTAVTGADISGTRFRDLPPEFRRHLQACIVAACEVTNPRNEATPPPASQAVERALANPAAALKTAARDELAAHLQQRPHLQAKLATLTYYSPSKWLLEQEMLSRGTPGQVAASEPAPTHWSDQRGDVYDFAAREAMLGLCFSGGGVRSATFNLGILQALAELDLLKHFDYLSTVSGGGYIHQWFAAWVKRSSDLEHVRKQLVPQPQENSTPESPEPIRWLRRYASYLTPRRGFFSTDLWVIVAVWFRNTILNQIVLFSVLGMLFALPHFLVHGFQLRRSGSTQPTPKWWFNVGLPDWLHTGLYDAFHLPFHHWILIGNVIAGFLFVLAVLRIAGNFRQMRRYTGTEDEPKLLTNAAVRSQLIVPLLAAAVWLAFFLQSDTAKHHGLAIWLIIVGLFTFLNLLLAFYGGSLDCLHARIAHAPESHTPWRRRFALTSAIVLISLACVASAAAATTLVPLIHSGAIWILAHAPLIPPILGQVIQPISPWRFHLVLLPPLYLAAPYFGLILLSGFLGSDYPEACREWLARFRAWNLLFAGLWTFFVGASLLGPYFGSWLLHKGPLSAIFTFVGAHITTLVAGSSGKGDGKPAPESFFGLKPMDLIAWIASPIAIIGLLLAVSSVVEKVGFVLQLHLEGRVIPAYILATSIIILACLIVQATLGLRIDVNIFSMHAFYRNRLARCYLGATNPDRRPDPFTGFDNNGELAGASTPDRTRNRHHPDETDINRRPLYVRNLLPQNWKPLHSYTPSPRENTRSYQGPFPIFCSTINLTFGQDLAWQERKGASFIFTPLYSGYHVGWTAARAQEHLRFNGYTPTPRYMGERGVALETAVAVSGAAMNPNAGHNTLPAVAFLMTLFNVRLGWWIWNPRHTRSGERRWRLFPWVRITRPSPVCAMSSLMKELLGAVDDTSQFVLLTDGGHFENMGLYELVRRRCKYIVICDAEEDKLMQFQGIGNAIRTCRIDFGAEIDLDLRPLQLQKESPFSQTHCVVGTIKYPPPATTSSNLAPGAPPQPDSDFYEGIVVYIKASLVGDEPGDILNYKNANTAFPQDPTTNQWFTESQFESYRRLGHHIGIATFQPAASGQAYSHATIGELFRNLLQIWYPPTPEMQAHFLDNTQRCEELLSELRDRAELDGLADALFAAPGASAKNWKPRNGVCNSYALQFGNSLIDFMWSVYNNLQLAFLDNRTSPHAQAWIGMFLKWSSTELIRNAWLQFGDTYPKEFRLFATEVLWLPRLP
jgi:hypothetical protein